MAVPQSALSRRTELSQDLVRVILFVAAVVVLMLIATALFGVQRMGPSFELAPDPGAPFLPF